MSKLMKSILSLNQDNIDLYLNIINCIYHGILIKLNNMWSSKITIVMNLITYMYGRVHHSREQQARVFMNSTPGSENGCVAFTRHSHDIQLQYSSIHNIFFYYKNNQLGKSVYICYYKNAFNILYTGYEYRNFKIHSHIIYYTFQSSMIFLHKLDVSR